MLTDQEAVRILHARVRPEEWGEAWLVMRACAERYVQKPGGVFELFFVQRWKWRKIDRLRDRLGRHDGLAARAKRARSITMPIADRKRGGVEMAEIRDEGRAMLRRVGRCLSLNQMDALHAMASGMSIRETMEFMGIKESKAAHERSRAAMCVRENCVTLAKRKQSG